MTAAHPNAAEPTKVEGALSIIIPVYNKIEYLESCVESLANQTAEDGLFEAIFIDDGSTDGSLALCEKLAKANPFMHVHHKENGGVSSARNAGLKLARYRFVLFLDADDSISENTVQSIVATFNQIGDSVDVVSYPIKYLTPQTGKSHGHTRTRWLKRSGIYHLKDVPHIAQSTMNICIRNRYEENVLFDETMKMGEDQLFITENLKRKKTIGYCKDAEYTYIRDGSAASYVGNSPIYAFEDMIRLFSSLKSIAESDSEMRDYCYSLILYNVGWRMSGDTLFPKHLRGAEREEADSRLASILSAIPVEHYENSPYLNAYHKTYFAKLYNLGEGIRKVGHYSTSSIVFFNNDYALKTIIAKVMLERCHLIGDELRMRGRLACPTFIFEDNFELFVTVNGKRKQLELSPSSFSYTASKVITSTCKSFSLSVPLQEKGNASIAFEIHVNNERIPRIGIELSPTMHNARIVSNTLFFKHASLKLCNDCLVLERGTSITDRKKIALFARKNPTLEARRAAVKAFIAARGHRRSWMYADLPQSRTEGNALAQMLYDMTKDDGIDRYYISEHGRSLTETYPQLAGHVVKPESPMHVMLSLRSEMVFASYIERFTYLPLSAKTFNQLGDLAVPQTRVYLQHGILHAHMPWYFSYDRLLFDKEVISTTMEKDSLQSRYAFPPEALLETGAPRLDKLSYSKHNGKKKILYVPSWRNYLVSNDVHNRTGTDATMLKSHFYMGVSSFIDMVDQSCILKDTGLTLELKLHPNFECYRHLFEFGKEQISLAPAEIDEGDYGIVITDFSSYVYDFVYSGARVIYYLPDSSEFRAGLNHYSELELPFSEGFGPYCETPEAAVEALLEALDDGSSLFAEFENRREGFFLHTDSHNRERLYEAATKLAHDQER